MKKIVSAIFIFAICHLPSAICHLSAQSDPLVESGKVKQQAGNHAGAIYDFTSAIKQNESEVQKYLSEGSSVIPPLSGGDAFAIPYYLRGYSYSTIGKNDEAMNDFTMAIKINPAMGAAYYQRGKLLWSTGKKEEGCIDLGMAGSLKDSSAREMFDEKFCWKEAVAAYKDASSKVRLNDYAGALDVIQKTIKLCPDSANYLGIRGRAYLGLGNYDLAMSDFDKAISLNQKKSVDAYYGRGMAYYSKNKFQEAFDDLCMAIKIDEKLSDAYLYRAYTCEGMGKNSSALFDYQQVQRLRPGDALAFMKSGALRNAMNDSKGACNDYRRAAALGNMDAQDYVEKCDKEKKK
ncbi:MAG: tetratricopeptide repeat protein [Bacteroidetes bacterium]|nr:tetratricopeptide repeat protein [Bacteroidota bacterium]